MKSLTLHVTTLRQGCLLTAPVLFGFICFPQDVQRIRLISLFSSERKTTGNSKLENLLIEPAHEIMSLFVLRKLILQTSSGARCLIFGRTLRLLPYFMYANSKGSGETARMCRLARAFTGRLCESTII